MELKTLVDEFARNVAAQGDAIGRGDSSTGNKYARRYIATLEKLRSHGDAGREALAALLKHQRADVRAMAAGFLLRYRTVEAKTVLEEVVKEGGLAAIGATMTLKRWEEGTWNLDPA